jgi:hypothetical protein
MLGHFFPLRKAARIGRARRLAVGVAAATLCGALLTQVAVADGVEKNTAKDSGTVTWGGLGWGLGIAADFDTGGTRVANASVVNGIVRLNDTSSNVGVSFVLEAHYFFTNWSLPATKQACTAGFLDVLNCNDIGIGPFVALEVGGGTSATPSANGPITGYALGVLFGMHHPTVDTKTGKITNPTSSWNFGIGLRVDPKAQVLGDGLVANQPLPAGDSIRYKTEPRPGIMLMSSFSF